MRGIDVLEAVGNIKEEYILEEYSYSQNKKPSKILAFCKKNIGYAVAIALLVGVGFLLQDKMIRIIDNSLGADGVKNINMPAEQEDPNLMGEAMKSNAKGYQDFEEENSISAMAKIVDWRDNSYFIIGLGDGLQGLCNVNIEDTYIPNLVEVGDIISFNFDGTICETYPAKIGDISNIQLVEKESDTIGVYREALMEIRKEAEKEDEKVDKNVGEIILDLTEVNNLSSAEKEALTYLFSCDIGMFDGVYQASIVELEENKEMAEDAFPEGISYKISNVEESDGFRFDIEMRTSLGKVVHKKFTK